MSTSPRQIRQQVVILIFVHAPALRWFEAVSLLQCFKILGNYPIRLVCPEGLDVTAYRELAPGLVADHIHPALLESLRSYNRMKIHPFIYRKYSDFKFILTYELDAFVFRDELNYWCSRNYDYIGAPWFEGFTAAMPHSEPSGVGNSGFSLRCVQSALRVTHSWTLIRPLSEIIGKWRRDCRLSAGNLWMLAGRLGWKNIFHHWLNFFDENEDIYWSLAGQRINGFKVAPYDQARRFSFEVNPGRLFGEEEERLPFGCHKWMNCDPDFWKPFIEAEGYLWGVHPALPVADDGK